jgi:hypothetical protein
MKIVNKICFYLNFTRDVSMYADIFSKIDPNKIFFIFNDLYREKINNNKKEFRRLKFFLKKEYPQYNNILKLSKLNKNIKFKVLVSAADLPTSKISVKSLIKFLLKKIILKKNAEIYEKLFLENQLAVYSIRFPNNLDRNIKYFPQKSWEKIFNVFLVSLKIEKILINKKFKNKKIYNICFPRLEKKHNKKKIKNAIIKEFKLDPKKKIISYLPTLSSSQSVDFIKEYTNELKKISQKFNLVIRPHPKEQDQNTKKLKIFKNSKLTIDLKNGRDTSGLIIASDFIICDGGSSILDAIYLKKKVVIHHWTNKVNQNLLEQRFTDKNRIDNIIISKILKFSNLSSIINSFESIDNKTYQKKINMLHKNLFFKNKINVLNIIKKYLYKKDNDKY